MGILASQYFNAWCRPQPGCADDPDATQKSVRSLGIWAWLAVFIVIANQTAAETYRIATFAAPLGRDGPGLLLRDINRDEDPQIEATRSIIAAIAPDIIVLTDFDYDLDGVALAAFAASFDPHYPHYFARQPNAGLATGLDLDGNGRLGDARDAHGYGRFAGDGGMAILSRYPIDPS